MKPFILTPGALGLESIIQYYLTPFRITLDSRARPIILAARHTVEECLKNNSVVYGVNTGFGKFSNTIISQEKLIDLQHNLILSHAVGTGPLLSESIIRLIYLLKINGLGQGYSGVRLELIEKLIEHHNAGIIPCVPSKGSVGASGDLAPLAHFSLPLMGEGKVWLNGECMPSKMALTKLKLSTLRFLPKEGLSMINGLQVSLALALEGLILSDYLLQATVCAGALSVVAAGGRRDAFDKRLIDLLNSNSASQISSWLLGLLHSQDGTKQVQDPYSLRCQPQVMGACLEQMSYARSVLSAAINAISDNPIVFSEDNQIVSGGNFHGQAISMASDGLAIAIATIGNMSERRIALLMDPNFSHLPAFLVERGGENSGLMMLQVTAAALASENKVYAHPASVDTIPTSNNQEDHVSMATFSAHRLGEMLENAMSIVAIELIASCQAIDFQNKTSLSPALKPYYDKVRKEVAFYNKDRSLAEGIEKVKSLILKGDFKLQT
jgi:histidine ammonia-lyase